MVVIWSKLSHPNILKFLGVRGDIGRGQYSFVSEWMARGNIVQFIRNYSPNIPGLVRALTSFPSRFLHLTQVTDA
jgi:hypothetical protein